MAEDKCSLVETYLQLYFCWRVMDKGRRNTTLMVAVQQVWTVSEEEHDFLLFCVPALQKRLLNLFIQLYF